MSGSKSSSIVPTGRIEQLPDDLTSWDFAFVNQLLWIVGDDRLMSDDEKKAAKPLSWKVIGVKDGVEMMTADTEGSAVKTIMGRGIVPLSFEELELLLRQHMIGHLLDAKRPKPETLKQWDSNHFVHFNVFPMPFPVTDREFVWYTIDWKALKGENRAPEDLFVSVVKGIKWDEHPAHPKRIRGDMATGGFVIKRDPENPDNACHLSYVVQADPGGWLPAAVVNMSAGQQAALPLEMRAKAADLKAHASDLKKNLPSA